MTMQDGSFSRTECWVILRDHPETGVAAQYTTGTWHSRKSAEDALDRCLARGPSAAESSGHLAKNLRVGRRFEVVMLQEVPR